MAGIDATVTTTIAGASGSACTLAERHRDMAAEYSRLSTIGSSTEVQRYNLRMAEHYSSLADLEEQGAILSGE